MSLYQWGDAFLCKVFPTSLDEGFIAWFQQQPLDSITSFADLSKRFAQAYDLQIEDGKWTDIFFEIAKYSYESFNQFVDWFEEVLKLFTNLD